MESAYGIGVANRYALFLDSEDDASSADPYALLATAAADAEKLGGPKGGPGHHGPAAAAAGKGAPGGLGAPRGPGAGGKPGQKPGFGDAGALSESKANVNANQKDAGRQQKGSRTGNQNQRPVRGDQENRTGQGQQRSPRPDNAPFRSPTFGEGQDGELKSAGGRDFRDGGKDRRNGFGPRGGRGGPGGPRGGPGARFGGGGGKRDFNRHSGSDKTGVKATEKRDGAGAHNWGKPLDDFTAEGDELVNGAGGEPGAESAGTEGAHAEGGAAAEGAGEEGKGGEGAEGEAKGEEEPIVKTLDEYKREREEKRLHTQFNTRKANEGEDKSKWKKTYVLKKKEKTDEEEVEYEEIEVEEDPNKRRGRQVLDIEINFRPSEESRGADFGRRGRGGPGGRGGPRTPRPEGERGEGRPRGPPRGEGGEGDRGERRGPPRGEGEGGRPPRAEGGGGHRGGGRPDGPGRGGPGGRGGRGGQQGGRGFQAAPKFDDLNDFPSL